MFYLFGLLLTIVLVSFATAAPAHSGTSSAPTSTPTDPYASNDPNKPLWNPESDIVPQPIRGPLGANILGSENVPLELQNPDALAPPTTDNGDV
jgi:hypothetical protein